MYQWNAYNPTKVRVKTALLLHPGSSEETPESGRLETADIYSSPFQRLDTRGHAVHVVRWGPSSEFTLLTVPHMGERVKEVPGASFRRTVTAFRKRPLSGPN